MENEQMDTKQKEFYDYLRSYTESLKDTIHLLYVLLKSLDDKAKGAKLSYKEHHENNEKYQESIKKYHSYGEKLNELYDSI